MFSDFCSSTCGWVSPFGAPVFVESLVAGLLRRSRLVAPGGGAEFVLVVLLYLVSLLVLAVAERFLLACQGLLSLLGACLWFSLVSVDFLIAFFFFSAFSELRSARQVERFAVCSFDICDQ